MATSSSDFANPPLENLTIEVKFRMLQKLAEILKGRKDKKGPFAGNLWALTRPYQVLPALVWGQNVRSLQETLPEDSDADDPYSSWFPALTSSYEESEGEASFRYVLCEPLLFGDCHRPWRTRVQRLRIEWALTPTPSPAPVDIPSTVVIEEIESDEEEVIILTDKDHDQTTAAKQGNDDQKSDKQKSDKGDKEPADIKTKKDDDNTEDQRGQDIK